MFKKTAALFLMSTALASAPALAQTSSSSSTSGTSTASSASGNFVTEQRQGEFRASKFAGLDIYGSENQKVGDIKEILIDGQGQAKAVVIGVGGFLGIGEKNVAVPWNAVDWKFEKPTNATASNATTGGSTTTTGAGMTTSGTTTGSGATTTGAATSPTMGTAGTATTGPATTASTTPAATSTRSPADQAAYNGYPDHGMIKMSKADLQNAPEFKYVSDTQSSSGRGSNASAPARQ